MGKQKETFGEQTYLMKALNFDSNDLETNRHGELSAPQRRQVRWSQIFGALGWWLLALIGITVFVFPNKWHVGLPDLLVNLGAIVVGVSMAFLRQYQATQALKNNKASTIRGPIQKTCRTENARKVYRVILTGRKFVIDKTAYNLFEEGKIYTFYYELQTERLLSVEMPA